MTKEQKHQLYILLVDLQTNLTRLHAQGTTGTLMDDSLDIMNKMVGYFIISGTDQERNNRLDEQAEISNHENWRQNS